MDFFQVFLTAPTSIIALFIISKLIGNKQIANLNIFDYINGITIGSIAAEMATSELSKFWVCFVALVIYGVVVMVLTFCSRKSLMASRFFEGTSVLLFDHGKIYKTNLKMAKIDFNEFLAMLRNKGYFCLEDIETVFMEQNGQISVLPKEGKRPVTPDDLKIVVHQSRAEIVVIFQGKILEKNLKATGNNQAWLKKCLEEQNKKLEDVFAGVCDGSNNLKIVQISNEKIKNDFFE